VLARPEAEGLRQLVGTSKVTAAESAVSRSTEDTRKLEKPYASGTVSRPSRAVVLHVSAP
jgi:hypothetical protein